MTRLIVLTDIHGCIKELESLLGDINPGHSDEVVCLGDITDKGPDPISCIRLLINSRAVLIASNHDERYAVALRKKKSPSEKYISLYNELVRPENEDCAEYLKNKLAFYQKTVGRVHPVKLTFIHGGVTPHNNLYNLSGKDYNEILRARYVDKHGNFVRLVKGDDGVFKAEIEDVALWQTLYDYRYGTIIHGHNIIGDFPAVWSLADNKFIEVKDSKERFVGDYSVISIDTGCYKGGSLTAAIIDKEFGNIRFQSKKAITSYSN